MHWIRRWLRLKADVERSAGLEEDDPRRYVDGLRVLLRHTDGRVESDLEFDAGPQLAYTLATMVDRRRSELELVELELDAEDVSAVFEATDGTRYSITATGEVYMVRRLKGRDEQHR